MRAVAASRRRDLSLWKLGQWTIPAGLLVVVLFYGEEFVHYKRTLLGSKERFIVRDLDDHPGCTLRNSNPRELLCPFPEYNSVRLGCLNDQCTYEDPDATEITPDSVEAFRRMRMAQFGKMPGRLKTWKMRP